MFRKLLLPMALLAIAIVSSSHDYILLADEFFLSKGDKLVARLLVGDEFKDLEERKYQSSKTARFQLLEGGKKIDIRPVSQDSLVPVFTRPINTAGLALLAMDRSSTEIEFSKEKFIDYLSEEGLVDILEKVRSGQKEVYKERYTRYLKMLVSVDKPSGSCYNELLGQELEIVLDQNPYKMQYGADITATVYFKGKPLKVAQVGVETRGLNGSVFSNRYSTDNDGKIFFKLNRAGTWVVRLVHMLPSADASADYQSWWASYTFGFRA